MSKKRFPAPPGPLPEDSPGFRYWCAVHDAYMVPEPQQQALMYQACLVLNRLDELDTAAASEPLMVMGGNRQMTINPLLQHAKDLRGTFLQLTKALALPLDFGDEDEQQAAADRSARARAAANARWGRVPRQ